MKILLDKTLQNRNKTMYRLSQDTGIDYSTILKLCKGKTSRVDFATLDKICTYLDCNVSDVLQADKVSF